MLRKVFNILAIVALMASFLYSGNVWAQESIGTDPDIRSDSPPRLQQTADQPNPQAYQRNQARLTLGRQEGLATGALVGTDQVLVLLVEFAGLDTFTWTQGVSDWDPLNRPDPKEATEGDIGDCANIHAASGEYSYAGPMHNQIPTPLSEADISGQAMWTQDFSPQWYSEFIFGNGGKLNYQRVDGSVVNESFAGKSLRNYYKDMSNGTYDLQGNVIGWLPLPHSAMWYANNLCPGNRSGMGIINLQGGNIEEAGSIESLVGDAVAAVNDRIAAGQLPDFDWKDYDPNGDGVVDHLLIVHAGYSQEYFSELLNRTNYGEAIPWTQSDRVDPILVDPVQNISVDYFNLVAENVGAAVLADQINHSLGAMDLTPADYYGVSSSGFWSPMSDYGVGYPNAFQPQAMDPLNLDSWGWLQPTIISDPNQTYTVTLQQASTGTSPVPAGATRSVRIDLPKGKATLYVPVWDGQSYWYSGRQNYLNSQMTLKTPLLIPADATSASLSFDLAYFIRPTQDFLWVQVSEDGGATWKTLTNDKTMCWHDKDWVGGKNGFPDDLCAAGIGGFTGWGRGFPKPELQTFDLTAFIGKAIIPRFWYMADETTTGVGTYIDNIKVSSTSGDSPAVALLSDDAETGTGAWAYTALWQRSDGTTAYDQSFYVQWRNTNPNGGYDAALGDTRWEYGKANTGMVVWYYNGYYTNNAPFSYIKDSPSFGPKGVLLVVDAHPEPYRSPGMIAAGYPNESANLASESLMRDAPFTLSPTVDFTYPGFSTPFKGQPPVKIFHDALGYYPGAEQVTPGPAYPATNLAWITKQWDASVVIPSRRDYALNAPGYIGTGTEAYRMNYYCSAFPESGRLSCESTPTGLGYAGGNGNPADVNGQYGWHIELLEESADHNWAKLRIWNSQYALDSTITPAQTYASTASTVTYTATFKNTGSAASFLACAAIDTAKLAYVAGSATGNPLELPACPTTGAGLAADASKPVGALVWHLQGTIPGAISSFTYQVRPIQVGVATVSAAAISFPPNQTIYTSQTTQNLLIGQPVFLPFISNLAAPSLRK